MDLSFQLFSAREFGPLRPILKTIRQLGYTQTEGWVDLFAAPGTLAADLKAEGLTMPTGHISLEQLKDHDFSLRIAETLGVGLLICPNIGEERRTSHATWSQLVDELAELCDFYRCRGLRFGWHSHEFEFLPTERGALPMDMILDGVPGLEWEFDIAWAVFGDVDPLPWIKLRGNRITALHLRDLSPKGTNPAEEDGEDVGFGTMDWSGLSRAVRQHTKTQYYVFEHDKPSDVIRFATRSAATAKIWG